MPKLRPLRKPEDIEKVPADQPVLIETAEEVVVVAPEEKPEALTAEPEQKPTREIVEPKDPDDLPALQKRLEELTTAEASARQRATDFERQAREESQRNQTLQQEAARHRNSVETAQYESVVNAIGAAEAESASAAQALEQAAANGEYKAQAEAQRKLSRAEARLDRLEDQKAAFEERKKAPKVEPHQAPHSDAFEQQIAQLPEAGKTWLRGHREFITDSLKNRQIQYVHELVSREGKAAFSTEYFDSLEQHLGLKEKPKAPVVEEEEVTPPRRSSIVSAPVSREATSPTTGRPISRRVELTAEERNIARLSMPGTPAGDAERIYAANKLKLEEHKRNGHYQER